MTWQGDRYHPLNEVAADLAGYCSDLEADNQRLRDELGKAQQVAKVLVHCYDNDNRPPSFALAYARALPVQLPHLPSQVKP